MSEEGFIMGKYREWKHDLIETITLAHMLGFAAKVRLYVVLAALVVFAMVLAVLAVLALAWLLMHVIPSVPA